MGTTIPNKFNRIGVFMFGGIGNYIMLTPFLKALRESSNNRYIVLIVTENSFRDVALEDGFVNSVFNIAHKSRFRLIWELRNEKLDTTIATTGINPLKGSLLALLSGAENRIGEDQKGFGLLYNYKLPYSYADHEVEGNMKLLEPLNIRVTNPLLHYNILPIHKKRVDLLFSQKDLHSSQTIIAMHPGSGERLSFKRWPVENFSIVAKTLSREHNAKIILLGGPGEEKITASVAAPLDPESFVDVAGTLTLKESGALLDQCTMLISNDTSLMHIASARKVPLLALFGPTMAHKTGPYTKSFYKIISSSLPCSPCYDYKMHDCPNNFACMKKIDVSDVLCEANAFLKGLQ